MTAEDEGECSRSRDTGRLADEERLQSSIIVSTSEAETRK